MDDDCLVYCPVCKLNVTPHHHYGSRLMAEREWLGTPRFIWLNHWIEG